MLDLCYFVLLLLFSAASGYAQSNSYLFVWAGDDAKRSSDFLAVLDAETNRSANRIIHLPMATQ
jgi:hypothetical protein